LFERVLRDQFSGEINEIVIDHPRLKYRIANFMKTIVPQCAPDDLIKFHTDSSRSVWSKYNLVRDIDQLFTNRIRLNCGGFLIIEEMETLTAIDVNTGKNIAGKTQEQTIVDTNLEAALEIAVNCGFGRSAALLSSISSICV
jgi:ribonuclease G